MKESLCLFMEMDDSSPAIESSDVIGKFVSLFYCAKFVLTFGIKLLMKLPSLLLAFATVVSLISVEAGEGV